VGFNANRSVEVFIDVQVEPKALPAKPRASVSSSARTFYEQESAAQADPSDSLFTLLEILRVPAFMPGGKYNGGRWVDRCGRTDSKRGVWLNPRGSCETDAVPLDEIRGVIEERIKTLGLDRDLVFAYPTSRDMDGVTWLAFMRSPFEQKMARFRK
jgi:hypothetical protein